MEIHFDIVGDNSDLAGVLNDTEKRFRELEQSGERLKSSLNFSSISDSSDGFREQLEVIYDALTKIGDGGSEANKKIISGLGFVIKNYSTFEPILRSVISGIMAQSAATAKDSVAKAANTVATTAQAAATRGATAAQLGLNAAMAANPLGLILTALGALLPLLLSFNEKAEESSSIMEDFKEQTEGEISKLSTFSHILRTTTSDTTAHTEALKGINKMAKEYNVTMLSENATIEEQRNKYIELTNAIKAAAQAKILQTKTEEAYSRQAEEQDAALERLAKRIDRKDNRRGIWKEADAQTFWQGVQANADSFANSIIEASTEEAGKKMADAVESIMSSYEEASGKSLTEKYRQKLGKEVEAYVSSLVEAQRETDQTVNRVKNTLSAVFKESTDVLVGPVESFGVIYDKARSAYEKALNDLADIEANRNAHTLQEYNDAKALVQSTKEAFKNVGGEIEKNGGTNNRASDKRRKAAEKAVEQEIELERKRKDISDSIARQRERAEIKANDLTIAAMKSGFERQKMELDSEHKKKTESIRKNYLDTIDLIEKQQIAEYKARNGGSSLGFVFNNSDKLVKEAVRAFSIELDAENEYYENGLDKLEQKREESRTQYLKQYGDYKEKTLAITEEYNRKIAETEDEWLKKTYEKQKGEELEELAKKYSSAYALIFSDVESLSSTSLEKAIDATQDEIRKAKNNGDIQALTELYKRLQEQLDKKNEKWGFSGLVDAFNDLASARENLNKAIAAGDLNGQNEAIIAQNSALSRLNKASKQISSVFSSLGSAMDSFGGKLGVLGGLFGELASSTDNIATALSNVGKEVDGAMKADAITAGLEATASLIAMIGTSIQANKQAQEEWNRTVNKAAQEYSMIKLNALDYKEKNIFGVENPYKKAIDGALQYSAAISNLRKNISALNNGQVQTGTKKVVDWSNVGKGAASGAGAGAVIGSVIPGIGTAIGAAIGAVIGSASGAVATKTVPVFESLLSQYDFLYNDETYELNPQILADYEKLDQTTKDVVDNWEDIRNKALGAQEQMRETFTELSGSLGAELSDSLVSAFRNGKLDSAIDDFHNKMNSTIEDIVEQMIFSNVFSDMFDNLQKEMESSFGDAGDNNIVDDLMRFEGAYKEGLEEYQKQMEDAREYLRSAGYDGFKKESETGTRVASTGGIQAMSQDSANELNGRFSALQASSYKQENYLSQIVNLIAPADFGLLQLVASESRDIILLMNNKLEDIFNQQTQLRRICTEIETHSSSIAKKI